MKANFFVFLLLFFILVPSSISMNHIYVVKSDSSNYVYVQVFLNESKNITIFICNEQVTQQYITFNQNALLGFQYGVTVYFVSQTPFTVNNVTAKYNPGFYGYTFSFKALNNTTFYINFLPKSPLGDEPYSNVITLNPFLNITTTPPPPPQPMVSPLISSSSNNVNQNIVQKIYFIIIIILIIVLAVLFFNRK